MSNWRESLARSFEREKTQEQEKAAKIEVNNTLVAPFFADVVLPGFRDLQEELGRYDRVVTYAPMEASSTTTSASITIKKDGREEIRYTVEANVTPGGTFPSVKYRMLDRSNGQYFSATTNLRSGIQGYEVSDVTREDIIDAVLRAWRPELNFRG